MVAPPFGVAPNGKMDRAELEFFLLKADIIMLHLNARLPILLGLIEHG